jgi:uncharacterized membrane protein
MIRKFVYIYLITLILIPNNAYAYLDPGTGSIILQAILGFIAASIATISFYWVKVKLFFSKIFKKDDKTQNKSDQ